jgi:hypothetical protein
VTTVNRKTVTKSRANSSIINSSTANSNIVKNVDMSIKTIVNDHNFHYGKSNME